MGLVRPENNGTFLILKSIIDMKRFFDYKEIKVDYENRELENFILKNNQYEKFIIFGNKDDTFFSILANFLKDFNKILVIIIPCMRYYPQDINDASLKDNVLIYEVGVMGMKATLNDRTFMYSRNKKNSIVIPRELYESTRIYS
jgi:hypothetical protein